MLIGEALLGSSRESTVRIRRSGHRSRLVICLTILTPTLVLSFPRSRDDIYSFILHSFRQGLLHIIEHSQHSHPHHVYNQHSHLCYSTVNPSVNCNA